ncbi:MAG: hypothetical protein CMH83_03330 [Nocardioides sp.]|nr:hypothetical protein [Nocardioides sp.]
MTTSALPRRTRTRQTTRIALTLGSAVLLGTTLTACGGSTDIDEITCGEFTDLSAGDQEDLVRDSAENEEDFEGLSEEEREQTIGFVVDLGNAACEGQDPDTKLADVEPDPEDLADLELPGLDDLPSDLPS